MKLQRHLIQKQKLDFDFASEETAASWNKHGATFYYHEVLPVLSQAFDANISGEKWYLIDRLEIDLGAISVADIPHSVSRAVEVKLKEVVAKERDAGASQRLGKGSLTDDNQSKAQRNVSDQVTVRNSREMLLEVFLNFLDHGVFKWRTTFESIEQFEKKIREEIGFETLVGSREFSDRMSLSFIRKRLFYQFSRSFTRRIFHLLFAREVGIISAFQSLMKLRLTGLSEDAQTMRRIRRVVAENIVKRLAIAETDRKENLPAIVIHGLISQITLIAMTGKDGPPASTPHLASPTIISKLLSTDVDVSIGDDLRRYYDMVRKIIASSAYFTSRKEVGKSTISEEEDDRYRSSNKEKDQASASGNEMLSVNLTRASDSDEHNEPQDGKPTPRIVEGGKTSSQADKRSFMRNAAEKPHLKIEGAKAGIEATESQGVSSASGISHALRQALTEYYVDNAGVILTWPYLNQLFTRLSYLSSTEFKDEKAHERAIHLMGYIASDGENYPEYTLTLPKFLTGWPLERPLMKKIKLIKKEKKEADSMLVSLIRNWPILKNTSINGLRSSFFHRDGKLAREDDGWRLTVEQKSYDMLLDYVPYTLSAIKLPWNKNILKVDWA